MAAKNAGKDKSTSKSKKLSEKSPEPDPVEPSEEEDSEDDSDNGGVTEEGMASLMKALGEDGLDDFDRVQLAGFASDDEEESGGDEVGSDEKQDEENAAEEDEESDSGEDAEDDEDEAMDADSAAEEQEEIPLDEVEDVDEDAVPKQKIVIDNEVAMDRIRQTIQLDPSLPWTETLTLTYPHTIDVDVNDDLNRELAFYKQALHDADAARVLASKHQLTFTRPPDYFAEMVKSDSHMERIRQRLLDEKAGIKKSEDKRKEREGKKFGKQVQIEKLKERERGKKEMEERLKNLKRKRKDVLDNAEGADDFDIAVEDAVSERPAKKGRKESGGPGGSKLPRQARDKKFGFGGAGRRSKQNTKQSTDDFQTGPKKGTFRAGGGGRGGAKAGGGSARRGGGGGGRGPTRRLGKSRRVTARSKK